MACFAPEFVWTNSISSCCLLLFVAIPFSGNFSSRVSGFRVVCSSIEFLCGEHGMALPRNLYVKKASYCCCLLLSFYFVRVIGTGFSDFTIVCIPNFKSLIEFVCGEHGMALSWNLHVKRSLWFIFLLLSLYSVGVFTYALAILGLCIMFLLCSELKLLAMVIESFERH